MTFHVANSNELAQAIQEARDGDIISMAPGSYNSHDLVDQLRLKFLVGLLFIRIRNWFRKRKSPVRNYPERG
jgi:hypothetical protein